MLKPAFAPLVGGGGGKGGIAPEGAGLGPFAAIGGGGGIDPGIGGGGARGGFPIGALGGSPCGGGGGGGSGPCGGGGKGLGGAPGAVVPLAVEGGCGLFASGGLGLKYNCSCTQGSIYRQRQMMEIKYQLCTSKNKGEKARKKGNAQPRSAIKCLNN